MDENGGKVRIQNLRDFTVQIRREEDGTIVGTGIVVSLDGKVVTCAHVVEAALGSHPREAGEAEVGVYFPQARGGENKGRKAMVASFFYQYDDDVVLLQLSEGTSPLAPEQLAVLGRAEDSSFHPFRSYGYRRLESYIAGHAHGMILDSVEPPVDRQVQTEPVQLQSAQINAGMSGAAVLDIERNLVVGIVSETWFPDQSTKDRDLAWAVNAQVLSLEPLDLPLRDEPLEKRSAPLPHLEPDQVAEAQAAAAADLGIKWNNAPPLLEEWTGRDDLLAALDRDWIGPERLVTGLIGFGGEGKSSLARQWVESSLADDENRPDGVFWWGFYEKQSVEEFLEAALEWMSGGRIDPRGLPGSSIRVQVISAMLGTGRYLFVLDGLEVMQHQEGDQYGLLRSNDLSNFLELFAAPGHQSFCLVTSRAPVLDLMDFTTYRHRDVQRLSPSDGRTLLRKLGVRGPDTALTKVVADWDGHALTLSLLGSYLAEQYDGDVAKIDDLPPPTADEQRYERVHRVLRRYDEHLSEAEQAFMMLFSAFRTPVHESAFEEVFRAEPDNETPTINTLMSAMNDGEFAAMVARLVTYRILRYDEREKSYTAHPLVRNHYFAMFTAGDRNEQENAHTLIKYFYLELAGETPYYPTIDDLAPLIEVVHHACRAGVYGEAFDILRDHIDQGERYVLMYELGAYGRELELVQEFFPEKDTSKEPKLSQPDDQRLILQNVGFCLMKIGSLREALPFHERANVISMEVEDWGNASHNYINLGELYIQLGDLANGTEAYQQANIMAYRGEYKAGEKFSLTGLAQAQHLQGDMEVANYNFQLAEALETKLVSSVRYLYGKQGIIYADYLHRKGQLDYARRVTEANLEICEQNHWVRNISGCHRILGDLYSEEGNHTSAQSHYVQALKITRSMTSRDDLIEVLLARGRWAARYRKEQTSVYQAFQDLEEALGYALDGGYRIYEADIRIALAWAYLANGDSSRAKAEAEHAQRMSERMGYHWGKVDAEEVFAALKNEG